MAGEAVSGGPGVLVVGAGPTGLAMALGLARRGVSVRIVDRNDGPGQASRAMGVHARTLELYDQLGIADEVVAAGIVAETIHLRNTGDDVARIRFADLGAGLSPYPFLLCYPQDDHERFLVARLAECGVLIEWGTELTGLTQDDRDVRARLVKSGATETCAVPYVCGCDGAHSGVRRALGVDYEGGGVEQLFYVADVAIAGGFTPDIQVSLSNTVALMMPVRRGSQRLIGMVPDAAAGQAEVTFEDVRPVVESLLGIEIEAVHWFSTYHVRHRVAERFRVGRCFLAGDAGHIHSPVGGQGMNTGIGDALNLSWKLAHVLTGRAAPALLDTYEAERLPFARTLVATTDAAFQRIISGSRLNRAVMTWAVPHVAAWLTGVSVGRRVLFRTVSQTGIDYHDSALSEGKAGAVRGGDRLPWVAGEGKANFAPLRSLDWQLHVYGQPRQPLLAAADELGLPVHAFAWGDAAGPAGLRRDAAYLVRPDAYVALALPRQDPDALKAFADRLGLSFRTG